MVSALAGQADLFRITTFHFAWITNPAWVVAFPLLGACVLLFFGKRIGSRAGWIASALLALSFVWALVDLFVLLSQPAELRSASVHLFDWISVGSFRVGAELAYDQLAAVMVLVVTGVGTLIHVYSIGYMEGDERFSRFFAYLNLFAASMLLLVLAGNVVLLYVGWEGVGLCSYLLIGFWFEKRSAANAAKKAFLVNRIGDFAFLLGIFLLARTVGTLNIGVIDAVASSGRTLGTLTTHAVPAVASIHVPGVGTIPMMSAGIATIVGFLFLAGATGKSAQIPLYVWLPDAMEGPTPVSALIHAATMVTAGVYLVARFSPMFELGSAALHAVAWIGAATALWAALMAATEYDIKRVLAYSTISQIGYMFLANGVHGYSGAIFHLMTHAFFKAALFLGAGAVMHALAGELDMRNMGGLRKVMPVTAWTFAAATLAISGIFPFAGFWSKDAILATAWAQGEYALWAIGIATAGLTAFYMARLYLRVFEGRLKVPEGVHAHDAPLTMKIALVPLGVLSVVAGIANLPHFLTLEHFLEPVVGASAVPHGLTPWLLTAAALLVAVAGIAIAASLYVSRSGTIRRRVLERRFAWLVEPARNKFYVDELYGRTIVLPGKAFAAFCASVLDARVIDGMVTGTGRLVAAFAGGVRRVQTGYVRNYAAIFFFGVVVVFSVLVAKVVGA